MLEPSGQQSSPFLILPPAQPRGMQSRMALAAATARGCFARPSSKAEVLLGHPQLPPQPPQASRTQPVLTEGDGEDTGLVCSSPRASAMFLQHRNHQEQARQQERRLSQRSRGKERISPPSSGFHPPSWLSSTCCRSGTCHKVS